jgi:nucleotide-binding universal stress UspA family protein
MKMYKRVLLAYDGSVEGALALREGALLAKACCSKVFLLSVVPETAGVQMAEGVQGGVVAQLTETYRDLLERAVERLRQLGFDPDARLHVGEPSATIGAVAREIGADLVVVGHRHQSLLSRWWSGSAEGYLCDHAGCSLLLCCNPISDEAFEAEVQAAVVA